MIFIFFSLFLVSSDLGRGRSWNPSEQVIVEFTAPLQKFIQRTISTTETIWFKYFMLVNAYDLNTHLKQEIVELRMENSRYRELLTAHERLQKLLQFKETIGEPVLAAQVIGRDPTGRFESVIIDKGEVSGLRVNMPVVNADGVVGRLVSVSSNYAKVLLIIDQNSSVDCIIQRSRDNGILKGFSDKFCKLEYVLKTSDVIVNDLVVTSGRGGVFPKGVPIGVVTDVNDLTGELFKSVKVKPLVDFSKLEELLIILKEDPLSSNMKEEE